MSTGSAIDAATLNLVRYLSATRLESASASFSSPKSHLTNTILHVEHEDDFMLEIARHLSIKVEKLRAIRGTEQHEELQGAKRCSRQGE
ncbi:hypothetical protein Dda_6009 [Drechslerella dactyloides]|uniref:Uncharacterized protein n=1 Tax=Drechslerella dactyloides TaxID=74499 RepID=A0AAD6IVH4_DREDA|nr:hypothetical protein Dda_6009 [Drechslerella dactyloides]